MLDDFLVGEQVSVLPTDNGLMDWAVGRVGTVTNIDRDSELIGVCFLPNIPEVWIAGQDWNEFFDFQLRKL